MKATIEDWKAGKKVERLWAGDACLWTNTDESKWLGWLRIAEEQIALRASVSKTVAKDISAAGFTHMLLLGMGGSSLCVEVLAQTSARIAGCPQVHVLDSTDPAEVRTVESKIDSRKQFSSYPANPAARWSLIFSSNTFSKA